MRKVYYILIVLVCSVGLARRGLYTAFDSGELAPDIFGRTDLNVNGGRVVENMFVWPHGPVEKRRGTYFIAEVADGELVAEIPGTPETSATYTLTYISENGGILGIPVGDTAMLSGLSGPAVDLGAGLVGLPYASHPFASGQTVIISNTSNYNATEVLDATTSADQLVITASFNAETFDGTEIIIQDINLLSGAGRMGMDNDGNMYYAHGWSIANNTYVTKVETDGTLVYDYLDMSNAPPEGDTSSSVTGLAITPDGSYLYILIEAPGPTDHGYVHKWNLSTGAEEWLSIYDADFMRRPQFDLDVDSDQNSYAACWGSSTDVTKITADGVTMSKLTNMGAGLDGDISDLSGKNVVVDNDMGIVIASAVHTVAKALGKESLLYNLAVRTFDDSTGDTILVGELYEAPTASFWSTRGFHNSCIVTLDEVIYALLLDPSPVIYKISWDGSDLAHVDNIAGPASAIGMYVDLYDNLVVINQDRSSPQTEVLHFYDGDLAALGTIDGFKNSTLSTWDAAVGASWQKGNAVFDGELAIADTPGTPAVTIPFDSDTPARLLSFESGNIIEAGHKYMRFYK